MPKEESVTTPAYQPARTPYTRRPKLSITHVSAPTPKASGTRLAAAETPSTFIEPAINQ